MIRRPPKSTRTDTLFPYTSLFRSLRVQSLRALARKVVKQIEAPRSPDPIMRRPCADCEEKRVTYGDDEPDDDADQEQLDLDNPNQSGLSYQLREHGGSRSVDLTLRHCATDRLQHLLAERWDVVDVIR